MNGKINARTAGIAMTLSGAALWGFCGSCGQYLFQYKGATSDWLVPLRLSIAGAAILLVLAFRDKGRVLDVWREPWSRKDIVLFAVFGMTMCQYAYFTTIQYSNAGTATVLQYTGPALILVYICLRDRKRPKLYELIALCCSMLGTFILATHGNLSQLAIAPQALLWGIAAAVSLVVYTLQPARLMKNYSTLLVLGWGMLLGGLLLAVLRRPWRIHTAVDAQTLLAMCFIIVCGTIMAFYFYLSGVKLVGAANASMLACVEPVAATVIAVVWLKVQFRMIDLAGFIFVLSTVFIISLNQMREEKQWTVRQGSAPRLQH